MTKKDIVFSIACIAVASLLSFTIGREFPHAAPQVVFRVRAVPTPDGCTTASLCSACGCEEGERCGHLHGLAEEMGWTWCGGR